MKKVLFVILILTLLLTMAAPVGATPLSEVYIEVETSFLGAPSPFVASGPAVDDGLICETGDVVEDSSKVTGFSSNGFNAQVIKHFICDDGSGEFLVNLQARIDFRKGVSFNWNVISGTGDYENLHGAGSGSGTGGVPCGDPNLCILDLYDGGLHMD